MKAWCLFGTKTYATIMMTLGTYQECQRVFYTFLTVGKCLKNLSQSLTSGLVGVSMRRKLFLVANYRWMCLFLLLFVYYQMRYLFCRRNLKWRLGRINLRNENGINPSSLREILKCMNSSRITSNISLVGLVQTSWNISGWQSRIMFLLYLMLCCPFSKHNSQF